MGSYSSEVRDSGDIVGPGLEIRVPEGLESPGGGWKSSKGVVMHSKDRWCESQGQGSTGTFVPRLTLSKPQSLWTQT